MIRITFTGCFVALVGASVNANNVAIDVTADGPSNGVVYLPGDIIRVAVRLRSDTTPVNSLELAQVDLRLINATLIPQFDPNDSVNPLTDAVIFGGAAPGEGQMPPGGNPQDWDGYPGPLLPGCPANCLIGSVPSAFGGGTIYFWLRTSTSTSDLLNFPMTTPGRLFIQFKIALGSPGYVTIDAIGPAVDDGSSSGAFFQQDGTGTIWSNGDADTVNNVVGTIPGPVPIYVYPEPGSFALLVPGGLVALRRRR
ncbi:MAG TPA: hypothetical protein VGM03_09550 [Phycisphaerae bacterium]|jgi:hypothetical protein